MILIILLFILMIFAFIATYLIGKFATTEKEWRLWIITFLFLLFALSILGSIIVCLIK